MNLPDYPTVCDKKDCIYMIEGNGKCQDPECNSGNSDAKCFEKNVKEVAKWLIWTLPIRADKKEGK